MKVLLVHNYYRHYGGEDAVLKALEKLYMSMGAEVELFTRHSGDIQGVFSKICSLFSAVYSFRSRRDFEKQFSTFQPDVVHIHNIYPLISPSIFPVIKRSKKTRLMMTLHNFRLICPIGTMLHPETLEDCHRCTNGNTLHCFTLNCRGSRLESLAYSVIHGIHRHLNVFSRYVDQFISPTHFIGNQVQKKIPIEFLRVFNPSLIDEVEFESIPKEKDGYFVFCGRISPEKGIRVIAEAFRSRPHLKLKVIGDGPLLSWLQGYVQKHEMNHVEVLGKKTHPEIKGILENALATLVPSVWNENFPNVVIEALSLSIPVICSEIGGVQEMPGDAGIYIRPGSVEDLAQACERIVREPEFRAELSQSAQRIYAERYSFEATKKNHHELLDRLISQGVSE